MLRPDSSSIVETMAASVKPPWMAYVVKSNVTRVWPLVILPSRSGVPEDVSNNYKRDISQVISREEANIRTQITPSPGAQTYCLPATCMSLALDSHQGQCGGFPRQK